MQLPFIIASCNLVILLASTAMMVDCYQRKQPFFACAFFAAALLNGASFLEYVLA